MNRKAKLAAVGAVTAVVAVGSLAVAAPAHADSWIVCVPYTETTGSCYQSFDDGTHSWFLYWGDHWIEF